MQFDSHEPVFDHTFVHDRSHTPAIAHRMHKDKPKKTIRATCNDPRHLAIGVRVVGVKCRE